MLTELALILIVSCGAFVFAAGAGRWSLQRPAGSTELRRLAEAAARASETFLRQQNRRVALLTTLLGAAVLATHAATGWAGVRPFSAKPVIWSLVGLSLGAILACSVAYVATQLALRGASRLFVAAESSLDLALSLLVRTGGAVGLLVEVASVAAAAGLFTVLYLSEGGPALDGAAVRDLLLRTAAILPAFALGAVVASSILQRGSTQYLASGSVGTLLSSARTLGVERCDSRNPGLVADLIGEYAGACAARALDMFATSALGNVAAWCIGIALVTAIPDLGFGALTLPPVVRALGLVASAFGLLAARTGEAEPPARGLWRGQAVAFVVALGGSAGATAWLSGPAWPSLTAAAAIGLGAAAVLTHLGGRTARARRQDALRAASDLSNGGLAVHVARGLSQGLVRSFAFVATLGVAICTAFAVGARAGTGGDVLGVSVAVSAMLAGGGYMLALGIVEPIVAGARNMGAVDQRSQSVDTQRRAGQLEDAGFQASAASQTFFIVAGAIAAMIALHSTPPAHASKPLPALFLDDPMILFSALLGSATVLAFAGEGLASATRAARTAAQEITRQLRGFQQKAGADVPPDYTPSYKTIVDQTSRLALQGGVLPIALSAAAPAALGICLRLMYTNTGLAIQGLSSFVVIAAATGLGMALVADGTRLALNAVHRAERPRGGTPQSEASTMGNALAELMGSSAGPAALTAAKTVTAAGLVVSTLLP